MPAAEPGPRVAREGDTLRFEGPLLRDGVAAAWKQAQPLVAGASRFDLTAVPRVDSAGVALLAELVARGATGATLVGLPQGLAELRAAYRLEPGLAFAG